MCITVDVLFQITAILSTKVLIPQMLKLKTFIVSLAIDNCIFGCLRAERQRKIFHLFGK